MLRTNPLTAPALAGGALRAHYYELIDEGLRVSPPEVFDMLQVDIRSKLFRTIDQNSLDIPFEDALALIQECGEEMVDFVCPKGTCWVNLSGAANIQAIASKLLRNLAKEHLCKCVDEWLVGLGGGSKAWAEASLSVIIAVRCG